MTSWDQREKEETTDHPAPARRQRHQMRALTAQLRQRSEAGAFVRLKWWGKASPTAQRIRECAPLRNALLPPRVSAKSPNPPNPPNRQIRQTHHSSHLGSYCYGDVIVVIVAVLVYGFTFWLAVVVACCVLWTLLPRLSMLSVATMMPWPMPHTLFIRSFFPQRPPCPTPKANSTTHV